MTVETAKPDAKKKVDEGKADDDMSEEDRQLKDELDMLMERLQEPAVQLYEPALQSMLTLIRSATTSMTSVPKPLKFMRSHYPTLRGAVYESIRKESLVKPDFAKVRRLCSDIISVLAMALCNQEENKLDTLQFHLRGSRQGDVGSWGHEYVRHLAHQVTQLLSQEDISLSELYGMTPAEAKDHETMEVDDSDYQACSELDLHSPSATGSGEVDVNLDRRKQLLAKLCYHLVCEMVDYFMDHNAEAEAVDLAQETVGTSLLVRKCSATNYQRACLYMLSSLPYLSNDIESKDILETCYNIYCRFGESGNALRCALRMDRESSNALILETLQKVPGVDMTQPGSEKTRLNVRRQLCFLLARHSATIDLQDTAVTISDDLRDQASELEEILNQDQLSSHFRSLARELDIMDPKIPEDVYKSHLEPNRPALGSDYDSAKANQAACFVNGLVNCGFGVDKLLMEGGEGSDEMKWVYKNKEFGMLDAVASLGWIMLWDVDTGLTQIDKYLYVKDNHIKAGALLACGVVNTTVHSACDPAKALLSEYLVAPKSSLSSNAASAEKLNCLAAIIGMGIAYAGTGRQGILDLLSPLLTEADTSRFDLACLAALSMGMISVGNSHTFAAQEILNCLMTGDAKDFESPFTKFMALGLALTTLNDPKSVLPIKAIVSTVHEPARSMTALLIDCCSLAGSGNVLKIQELLHILSEKYESKATTETTDNASAAKDKKEATRKADKKSKTQTVDLDAEDMEVSAAPSTSGGKNDLAETVKPLKTEDFIDEWLDSSNFDYLPHQPIAVLGIAIIAMGDDIGQDMAFRMFGHLLRFGELPIKRAVPLALALGYASNPQLKVLDLLSKFSHDPDQELSYNAILAMGIVGAGTNNARLAAMLRQLAIFHQRDSFNLFMVRLAQGLTHLGKGTMTLSPWHSDRLLANPCSVAALLAVLTAFLDVRKTFLNKMDYLFFYLTPAIQARLLMTFDEDMNPLTVSVRVGQAVDVVGQAGRPKTITGFQTHTTPVLLAAGERAELATEEYLTITPSLPLEGFVILKKNPNYEA